MKGLKNLFLLLVLCVSTVQSSAQSSGDGMAHICLKPDNPFTEQLTKENSIYVIQHDFDLKGNSVTIPENCVLEFDGGSLSNGVLSGSNTYIQSVDNRHILNNVELNSTFCNRYFPAEWFINDFENADKGINAAIRSAYKTQVFEVRLNSKIYCINQSIELFEKCRLIGFGGNLKTPSRGSFEDSCSNPIIYVTSSVTGLIVRPYKDDEASLNAVVIKDLVLNYNPRNTKKIVYSNSIKTNHGIHIRRYQNGKIQRIAFRGADISNVAVVNFKNGIYCQNTDYYPSGSFEWTNLVCFRNHVGLKIEGIGDYPENRVWSNGITFKRCSFSWNYLGGVYFDRIAQTELILFDNCVLEQNGDDYNPSMINSKIEHPSSLNGERIGAYGIRIEYNQRCYGQLITDHCYFEYNFFKRKSINTLPKDNEYIYTDATKGEKTVFPKNVRLNSFLIYSTKEDIVVKNCRINAQINFVRTSGSALTFQDNYPTYTLPMYLKAEGIPKNHSLITFDNETHIWYKKLIVKDVYNNKSAKDYLIFKDLTSYVSIVGSGLSSVFKEYPNTEVLDIDVPFENRFVINNNTIEGDFYIDKSVARSGIGYKSSRITELADFDRLLSIFKPNNKIFNVYVSMQDDQHPHSLKGGRQFAHCCGLNINPINFPDNYFTDGDALLYPSEAIRRAASHPELGYPTYLTCLSKPSTQVENCIYNDLTLNSVHIENQAVSSSAIEVLGGTKITFNNCIVDFGKESIPFIKTKLDNLVIEFNNCTLSIADNHSGKCVVTDNIHNTVIFNHCNVLHTEKIVLYNRVGTSSDRPAFNSSFPAGYQFFDTTINKPIYWTGTTWVDASGVMQ